MQSKRRREDEENTGQGGGGKDQVRYLERSIRGTGKRKISAGEITEESYAHFARADRSHRCRRRRRQFRIGFKIALSPPPFNPRPVPLVLSSALCALCPLLFLLRLLLLLLLLNFLFSVFFSSDSFSALSLSLSSSLRYTSSLRSHLPPTRGPSLARDTERREKRLPSSLASALPPEAARNYI